MQNNYFNNNCDNFKVIVLEFNCNANKVNLIKVALGCQ